VTLAETPPLLFDGPADSPHRVALAHGAGAPMTHAFMQRAAEALAGRGIRVARFEFPYMQRARAEGRSRPPDRQPVLEATWRSVIADLGAAGLVIAGKSMGGRMASLVAAAPDAPPVVGLVCLGYPFHPPGKPERTRTEHLQALTLPTLILQGERGPFGTRDEVSGYDLVDPIRLHWLSDGDHSFKPRKASGCTEDGNLAEAFGLMADFVIGLGG